MTFSFPSAADVEVNEQGVIARFEIDESLYSQDVALRAAYSVANQSHVHLARSQDGMLIAELRRKDGRNGSAFAEACGEFCNALIDFAVREHIATATHQLHDALLRQAFLEAVPKPHCDG
ncbi:His-Xaa-Ser system protein HxsD [Xanthobacteraceae bacterium Astr-EGSB]|uniref:His-Xaa-Ser system protein HxsD n=1 Tax=Astrobacterium formosum TaxID=3069710 RepID=UPI0027B4FF3E|nr:His-Xaa-Ser system protein HxsD [Xanthobacteraceae bacterium Astr-EGSB]